MFWIGYDLLKRPITLQHIHIVVNKCGFENYFQVNYVVEIFKIFDMLDCKAMARSMSTNLKFLCDESSELVAVTWYRHIIGSLMYLTNTMPDTFFVVNTMS